MSWWTVAKLARNSKMVFCVIRKQSVYVDEVRDVEVEGKMSGMWMSRSGWRKRWGKTRWCETLSFNNEDSWNRLWWKWKAGVVWVNGFEAYGKVRFCECGREHGGISCQLSPTALCGRLNEKISQCGGQRK